MLVKNHKSSSTRFCVSYLNSILALFLLISSSISISQELETIELKKKLKDSYGEEKISILRELSLSYRYKIPSLSEEFAKSALIEAQKQKNISQEIMSYRSIAAAKQYLGQNDSAIYYFQLSKHVAISNHLPYEAALSEVNLALVYIQKGEFELALKVYQSNLDEIEKKGDSVYLAQVYNNIGNLYLGLKEYEMALKYLEKSANIKSKSKDKVPYGITLSNMAIVYKGKENFKEARKVWNHGLEIFIDNRSTYNIALTYIYLSELEIDLDDKTSAALQLKLALSHANQLENPTLQAKIYQKLSDIYVSNREFEKAYAFYKKADQIQDSIDNAQSMEILNEQRMLFEVDILNEKVAKSEDALVYANKRNLLLYWIIGLIVLLIFGIVLSRVLIKRKNTFIVKQTLSETQVFKIEKQEKVENADELKVIFDQINYEFNENELYKDQKLTLNELSTIINSNSTYVSKAVNLYSNKNFKTFLNEFRVKKAVELISNQQNANLTLAAISEKAGFSSVSVFNRSFKQVVGVTPSYFLKSVSN